MKLNNTLKATIAGVSLLGASSVALADNVGGVILNPNALLDFSASTTLFENVVGPMNPFLSGIGEFTTLNGTNEATFCPGCELTFSFTYTLSPLFVDNNTNGVADGGDEIAFTNGMVNIYVDATPDYDATGGANSTIANATDGNLWLSLSGHTVTAANGLTGDLFATITGGTLGSGAEFGNGGGFLDAIGGIALNRFDTDFFSTSAGFADLNFGSDFAPIPNGGSTPDGFQLLGSADLTGNTIPEPGTIALFGAGLFGLAGLRRRRQNK